MKTASRPSRPWNTVATALATLTTPVNVSNAAAPEYGDELTATGASTAIWLNKSPRRFNVKRNKYSNLAGDGKEYYGTSINASSTTLTCTDGSFAASDVGKIIGVENAGAGGSWLITTITTYISATQVILALAASYTVNSIATVAGEITTFYGTDDTIALQTLINSAFRTDSTHWNGNCEFFFPDSLYIIGGALKTAVTGFASTAINYNSQIYIPNLPYKPAAGNKPEFSFRCTMLFKGETRPHLIALNGIGTAQSPRWGARLRSTIQGSGTYPSIIASKGGSNANDNWSEINDVGLTFEDLILEITTNSSNSTTMCGINASKAKYSIFNRVNAYPHNRIGKYGTAGAIAQPAAGTVGLISAILGDEWGSSVHGCYTAGFYYGYMAGEHYSIRDSMCWACVSGLGLIGTSLKVFIDNLECNAVKHNISYAGTGLSVAIVGSIAGEIEHTGYTGAWYEHEAVVNDPDNLIYGKLDIATTEGYVGYSAVRASKIGGQKLRVSVVDEFPLIVNHTGTTYTFQYLYEAEQTHLFSNAADITVTMPRGDTATLAGYCYNYDIGAEIETIQANTGKIIPVGASGCTVTLPTGMTKSNGVGAKLKWRKTGTNQWYVNGDLQA